jgi:hypothetical protein
MDLPENALRLRIYVGENDRWEHQPLHEAIVQRAREHRLAGATVTRGLIGFGRNSHLHTAKLLRLSLDLPLIIEIVDIPERIHTFLPELKKMLGGGLATTEPVTVVNHRS